MWQTSNQIVPQTKEPFSPAAFLKISLWPTTCFVFFSNGKAVPNSCIRKISDFLTWRGKIPRIKCQKTIMFEVRTLGCGLLNTSQL